MSIEGELDESVQQFGVRDATCIPQFGIHTDGGKSRNGIDLVKEDFAVRAVEQEIHSSHARTVDGPETANRHILYLPGLARRELGRDNELRAFLDVLGL